MTQPQVDQQRPLCNCEGCVRLRQVLREDGQEWLANRVGDESLKTRTPGQVTVKYIGSDSLPKEWKKKIETVLMNYVKPKSSDPEEDIWGDEEETIKPPEQQTAFVEEEPINEYRDIDIAVNIALLNKLEKQVEAMRLQAWALISQMDSTQELLQVLNEEAGL
jgi:hypothetical protein